MRYLKNVQTRYARVRCSEVVVAVQNSLRVASSLPTHILDRRSAAIISW